MVIFGPQVKIKRIRPRLESKLNINHSFLQNNTENRVKPISILTSFNELDNKIRNIANLNSFWTIFLCLDPSSTMFFHFLVPFYHYHPDPLLIFTDLEESTVPTPTLLGNRLNEWLLWEQNWNCQIRMFWPLH